MTNPALMPRSCSRFLARLARDTSGNALMIIAASLLPLLAMVGGSLDIGRGYLVQARLQQACDAGVLAARKRLGTEAVVTGDIPKDTADVGDRFFKTNFRDASYGTTTRNFQMTLQEDYTITGVAEAKMPTTIMGMFGEEFIDVSVDCSAQVNASNTDIMMALDVTGSMALSNSGDSQSRIDVLKDVIKGFHAQLSATAKSGARVRYGFVPYSTNVNVGSLLEDDWVTDSWGYQSRELKQTSGITYSKHYTIAQVVSGSSNTRLHETYPATQNGPGNYTCSTKPADTMTYADSKVAERSETVLGPPPGTRTTKTFHQKRNGESFTVSLDGRNCTVNKTTNVDFIISYDEITEPVFDYKGKWKYDRLFYDVSDWRQRTDGCIEERQTYEIDDYENVDFNKALDLNIDLVPTDDPESLGIPVLEDRKIELFGEKGKTEVPTGSITKWRPMYADYIYARSLKWNGTGRFTPDKVETADDYVSIGMMNTSACPAQARKLSTMSASDLDTYLDTLAPQGSTYHDIGMIWAARLLSPTGLFASENGDVAGGQPTDRNLIFLTDGETSPYDLSYASYGLEPLDQRRWSPSSSLTLTQTVEKRFAVVCKEARKRGMTVWVIGFGVELNPIMQDCAGQGRFFEAADAAELNLAFSVIAKSVAQLRIVD